MEQLGKIQFNTLGRWALGGSLMHGIGTLARNQGFAATALPFHLYTLHELIRPFCAKEDLSFLSAGVQFISGISLISEGVVRTSDQLKLESSKQLKMIHAFNEMVALSAFITTIVAAIFAAEARRLCMAAATIQAFCYMNRFYHETSLLKMEPKKELGSGVPECLKEVLPRKEIICPGREQEVKSIFTKLNAQRRSSVALLGPPGAGKTHLFKYLAYLVSKGECPERFKGYRFFEIDMNAIKADSSLLGTWEGRLKKIFEFARREKKVVLFLDEGHQAVGAGATMRNETNTVSNEMKKFIEETAEYRVILATTIHEYRLLAKDAAFANRFSVCPVNPFPPEYAKVVIEAYIEEYKKEGWQFPDNLISKIDELPEEYFHGSLRDQLSVLDELVSYLALWKKDPSTKVVSGDDLEEAFAWWVKDHSWMITPR